MFTFYKKVFILIFAVTFVLNVFPSAYAFSYEEEIEMSDAQSAYNFLMNTGILAYDELEFDAEYKIPRAYFVKLALHLSNDAPNVLISNENIYTDVTPSTKYENYIETAYRIGYISGGTDGLFRPDDVITVSEAVKILCEITGYGMIAKELGGYPGGYYVAASRAGILDGLTLNDSAELDMARAMLLCKNAVEADVMQYESFGDGVNMKAVKGETLLSERHKINSVEGIMNATFYTDLYSPLSSLEAKMIRIGQTVLMDPSDKASGYLGYEVKVYYNSDVKNGKMYLMHIQPTDNNKVITIDASDVEFEDTRALYYTQNNDYNIAPFDIGVTSIVNCKAKICSPSELSEYTDGSVKFISNNGDSKIDVILITSYTSHIVLGIDKTNGIILADDGSRFDAAHDADEYTVHIYRDGTKAELSDLMTGDSILVSRSESMQNGNITIMASSNRITGIFDEIGENYAIIEGQKYELADFIRNNVSPGKNYTAKLDAFGRVCNVSSQEDVVYGYLYDICESSVFNNPMCKIFTENNRWVELYFANKITCNGEKISAETMYLRLSNMGDDMSQLIRYKVNDDAEVIWLEMAKDIPIGSENEKAAIDNNVFRKSITSSGRYRSNSRSFEGRLYLGANTIIFVIPDDMDEEKFKISPYSALRDTGRSYNYTAYDVDDMLRCNVLEMSVIDDTASLATDTFMIFDSVGMKLNRDNDVLPSISGYRKGNKISFPVCVGDDGITQEAFDALKKGDMLHIKFNKRSEICHINVFPLDTEYYAPNGIYGTGTVIVGRVTGLDPADSKIRVKYDSGGAEMCLIYNTSMSIYVWDKSTESVYKASALDILPDDKIYANLTNLVANEIILVRE